MSALKGPILLGRADQLPPLPTVLRQSEPGLLFVTEGNWTGWAVLSDAALLSVGVGSSLAEHLISHELPQVDVGESIILRTLADVPSAQRLLLLAQFAGVLVPAHETRPGFWMGRNVRIDSSAKLVPPVFMGDNSVVASGAKIGPGAVIGADCMLGRDSSVQETTVCAGTYVGPGVELNGVIVDGRSLVNPQQKTTAIVDRRLLDRLSPGVPLSGSVALLLAGIAAVCAVPVVVATALWRRRRTRPLPISSNLPGTKDDVVADGNARKP
ncbi:MAG: hypothetical protein K8U57_38400 [Planctomycetes bacterium]|nr:hypothetical protein [Planctomycetota bacterium]